MYVRMIETRSHKILLKSFHETYSDLFKKTTRCISKFSDLRRNSDTNVKVSIFNQHICGC